MPVTINDVEVMDDTGKFTENFKPGMLGDDYAETGVFKNVPDLVSLGKAFADTKTALGKSAEGAIRKPGEGATDEQRAEYRKSLLKELGAPEKPEDYDFTPAEGIEHDEKLIEFIRGLFTEEDMPVDMAKRIVDKWDVFQNEALQEVIAAENEKFSEEAKAFKRAHFGSKLAIDLRTAAKAIILFSDEGLTKLLRENRIVEAPEDLEKWRQLGFDPSQLEVWCNVGQRTKADEAITNEGLPAGEKTEADKGSGSDMFDHPTSVAERRKVAKS